MDATLPDLGDLEREVMQLVWEHAPVTAEAVRERLERPLKESTVRTVLRRLEDKGYVTHTVEGRTYVYQAAAPRGRVAAKAVQRIVDWFCNGSGEEVLGGMVDASMLDQRQLRLFADKVAEAEGGKKRCWRCSPNRRLAPSSWAPPCGSASRSCAYAIPTCR